jgi:hypothetical protein
VQGRRWPSALQARPADRRPCTSSPGSDRSA